MTPTINRARLAELHQREVVTFAAARPKSAAAAAQAREHLLGGVPMPWMVRWPGPFPIFVAVAHGSTLVDIDGHEYIDFALGDTGAMSGHGLTHVADRLHEQARRGITTMLPTEDAAAVAASLADRFGLPIWQMAMTATDANRFALRLARYLTGRPKVLVFDGCYHGTVDETLIRIDPVTGAVVPRPSNTGPQIDPAVTTRAVQFNDIDALERALAHGDVAAVLAEPALTNIGIVLPDAGYHDALRAITQRHGTLLIIDETHTICAGPGGATRAWGLRPDLLTIGKPLAGGVPAAAYGMTAEVAASLHDLLADDGIDVSGLGGTLTANALAIAAMRVTLETALRDEDFAVAIPLAQRWADGVLAAITEWGMPWTVQRLGCRAEYWFCPLPRSGGEAAAATDHELEAFLHLWHLNRGQLLTPFHNMALLCPSHTADQVDAHTSVFRGALAALLD
jgi:glutamate-1-semialdehyde 2,1-aminomutase